MFFKQYYLGCLAHGSYLVGDEKTGKAVVIDPQRDVDQYVVDAEANGLSIEHVVLTHFHADFVAGHLELRDRLGTRIHLGARAGAEFDFNPLAEGDVIELGDVYLKTLETPGHTPEGISLLVYDRTQSTEIPYGVLTGDTLFIGDVGRPDLMASIGITAEELGGMLYDSLHEKLLPLPDETLVYPAHGAGSMCGKNLSDETSSTMGMQRQYNYALQPMSKERFIEIVTADQPEAPRYFSYDAMLNRKERTTLEDNLRTKLQPMSVDEVLALENDGAQILDVREPAEFEPAHMVGSINVGLGGSYATWAGTLLDHETPIVIIAEPGTESEAATRLGRIGFDRIAGYLNGGMEAFRDRDELIARTGRVAPRTLAELLASDDPPWVVDVRTASEYRGGAIDGAFNIPLNQLSRRIAEIPRDRDVVVHCATGYRSSIASSLLGRRGFDNVADLVGGFEAYRTLDELGRAAAM
jgi:glyoxylase-like metal-dependent hydrolase (beta-lactamase superfamily II)/rhodanese-related sulfurtransferase